MNQFQPGGSLFGQASSSQGGGGSLFGQSAGGAAGGQTQQASFSFRQPQDANAAQTGSQQQAKSAQTGLFGSSTPNPSSGGLFVGSSGTSAPFGKPATQNSLFGSGNTVANTNANAAPNLFANSSQLSTSAGGLFGNASAPGGSTSFSLGQNQSGGLFGNKPNSFGTPNTGGGLFGGNTSTTNASAGGAGGLFGNPNGNANGGTNTGGLLGNTGPNANQGGITGGLFGNSGNTAGLVGNSGVGTGNGGLFGGANSNAGAGNNLFSSQQPQPQPLVASIDQASFVLPDVAPSAKLYTSLALPTKRVAAPLPSPKPRVTESVPRASASLIRAPSNVFGGARAPLRGSTEPRQLLNSYEQFLRDRPTTLVVHLEAVRARVPAPVSAARPAIASDASVVGNTSLSADSSKRIAATAGALPVPLAGPDASRIQEGADAPDVSIFYARTPNANVVRINESALEEGYYSSPSIEELANMSPTELRAVSRLVIGRSSFGKIEYAQPVDLSGLENLGDLLGVLVVFEPGTVCVYPDESRKAPVGHQLNVPATITLENTWPRDRATGRPVTDDADPRVLQYVQKLRDSCTQRGAEFAAYANGVYAMRVPHFSTWGVDAEDMYVDAAQLVLLKDTEQLSIALDVAFDDADSVGSGSTSVQRLMSFMDEDSDVLPGLAENGRRQLTWLDLMKLPSALDATDAAAAAASRPTQELDLGEMLLTSPHPAAPSGREPRQPASAENLALLRFARLQGKLQTLPRNDSPLPLLRTAFVPADLPDDPLWRLLRVLYPLNAEAFEEWLDSAARAEPAAEGSALEAVLQALARHEPRLAAQRAQESANVHLGVVAALLAIAETTPAANDSAREQLRVWQETGQSARIPAALQRVWKLAAGEGLSEAPWPQQLGTLLWYSPRGLAEAVAALPSALFEKPESAGLRFVRAVATHSPAASALARLDRISAFIAWQLVDFGTHHAEANRVCYDDVLEDLVEQFLAGNDGLSALCLALHVTSTSAAARLVARALQILPLDASLPTELVFPEQFLNEMRATQVAQRGQYRSQAEYLLLAKQYSAAHTVLIAHLAPVALLSDLLSDVADLLQQLDAHKDAIKDWATGGAMYLAYLRAQTGTLLPHDLPVLFNACKHAQTPTLISRAAVSRIASWFAAKRAAWHQYDVHELMGLKYTPSDARAQAMQQVYRLLL